jgi:hypothetical protein
MLFIIWQDLKSIWNGIHCLIETGRNRRSKIPFSYLFVSGDPKESKDKTIHEMKDKVYKNTYQYEGKI